MEMEMKLRREHDAATLVRMLPSIRVTYSPVLLLVILNLGVSFGFVGLGGFDLGEFGVLFDPAESGSIPGGLARSPPLFSGGERRCRTSSTTGGDRRCKGALLAHDEGVGTHPTTPIGPGPVLDDVRASELAPLFTAAALATVPRDSSSQVSGAGEHDAFRYEWGTWVNDTSISDLMGRVDEIRLRPGAYDSLLPLVGGTDEGPVRIRVAGGRDWDCVLHLLPRGSAGGGGGSSSWEGRWPTGSWALVKSLAGVAEVAMLRGPDRDGVYRKATKKDLRGGADGTLGGGGGGGGLGGGGDDCVKYVGGPLRSYEGKSVRTALLEVVVRPPVGAVRPGDGDGFRDEFDEVKDAGDVFAALAVVVPPPPEEEADLDGDEDEEEEAAEAPTASDDAPKIGSALMGTTFDEVGGLDAQLDAIARRVLASRANPAAARRLGVSHVRGVLLSGPPGCGKTLLARELSGLLGAREPQIVNGPEILDKFIGEAEKKVRDLFLPAEREYAQSGDDSALHVIILDEMDAIARKRGSSTADTTGVRDSVVNQLLAKMDGVRQASNVLVVGLTNRPELLDPALLRPGRLEVQLRVELPDLAGRRDIFRIHTRRMRGEGGLGEAAGRALEDLGEGGIPARTEHFTGAEIAGLVRSAASFALARTVRVGGGDGNGDEAGGDEDDDGGKVSLGDLDRALREVRPALGRQDDVLKLRYPRGISPCSSSMRRVQRDLERFTAPATVPADDAPPRVQSLLLVGGAGGNGVTALAAWAAAGASSAGSADYVRFVTALDVLSGDGGGGGSGGGDGARAAALTERFAEAREMSNSLLVLDDVDQLCAGSGPGGYSSVMLATLRALLRSPPESSTTAKAGGQSESKRGGGKTIHILATTSRSDAACVTLHELFDETVVVPVLSEAEAVQKLLLDSLPSGSVIDADPMAHLIIDRLGGVGCKTALRLAERAVATASRADDARDVDPGEAQLAALAEILDDLAGDEVTAERLCEVY